MSTIVKDKATIMEEIRRLISEGVTVELKAKGYSMNPFIMHLRDELVLGPWEDKEICKGAVVLVKDRRGCYLVHRIIERNGDEITLMGDGNIGLKEKADIKEIIGILKAIKRKGRTYNTADSKVWRLYSTLWTWLTPLRRWPLGLWRRLNPQQPLQ